MKEHFVEKRLTEQQIAFALRPAPENPIERFFRRIKQCRRVATRYEKKTQNFAAFVWLAAGLTAVN